MKQGSVVEYIIISYEDAKHKQSSSDARELQGKCIVIFWYTLLARTKEIIVLPSLYN